MWISRPRYSGAAGSAGVNSYPDTVAPGESAGVDPDPETVGGVKRGHEVPTARVGEKASLEKLLPRDLNKRQLALGREEMRRKEQVERVSSPTNYAVGHVWGLREDVIRRGWRERGGEGGEGLK